MDIVFVVVYLFTHFLHKSYEEQLWTILYIQLASPACFFGLWERTRGPGINPHRHGENVQTSKRIEPRFTCCEATMPPHQKKL